MTIDIVQLKEKGKFKYTKTHVAAIDGIESYPTKVDTDKMYQKITKKEPLWTGVWYGGASGSGTAPSKPLSQCQNGWVLQWQEMSSTGQANDAVFQFQYVPKNHISNSGSGGTVFNLNSYNGKNPQTKYLYIKDAKITGHDLNAPNGIAAGAGNKMYVLTKIFEY